MTCKCTLNATQENKIVKEVMEPLSDVVLTIEKMEVNVAINGHYLKSTPNEERMGNQHDNWISIKNKKGC